MSDRANGHPSDELSAYLDDEVQVEDRARIDRHLAACESCREHLDGLRRLSRAVAEEAIPEPPHDLAAKVGRRIDTATVIPFRRRRFVVPASVAATVAAVGLLAVLAWKQGGPDLATKPVAELDRASRNADSDDRARAGKMPAPGGAAAQPPPLDAIAKSERAGATAPSTTSSAVPSREESAGGAGGGFRQDAVTSGAPAKDERAVPEQSAVALEKADTGSARKAQRAMSSPAAPCGDSWVDSGVQASWETADRKAALRSLDALASAYGGRVDTPSTGNPDLAWVVIPRDRFFAFCSAAGSAGVQGLPAAVTPDGAGCIRQRIAMRAAGSR